MKEKVYVDRLFASYEDSPEIRDLKEEITSNLTERIVNLVSSGMSEDEAFEKATSKLGDITVIADETCKKQRNDVIRQVLFGEKIPFTKKTAAGLTVASGIMMFFICVVLTMVFYDYVPALVVLGPLFLSVSVCLYTYFGLTQETVTMYAMKNGRAALFATGVFLAVFAAGLAASMYFYGGYALITALVFKAIFIIPAICLLVFLGVTEPDRNKPWFKAWLERELGNANSRSLNIVNPAKAARFGVYSGGLWILSIGAFILLHIVFAVPYAWLVFVFALAAETFMVASIFEK